MSTATCNLCFDSEHPFTVPWDAFGKELMEAHYKERHPEEWRKILKERKDR